MVAITPGIANGWKAGVHRLLGGLCKKIQDSLLELNPKIQLYDIAAVVTYYYDSSCEREGETLHLTGRDMFMLVKEKGKW